MTLINCYSSTCIVLSYKIARREKLLKRTNLDSLIIYPGTDQLYLEEESQMCRLRWTFVVYDYISAEHEDKRFDINALKTRIGEKLEFSCLPNARTWLLFFSEGALIRQNTRPSSSQKVFSDPKTAWLSPAVLPAQCPFSESGW